MSREMCASGLTVSCPHFPPPSLKETTNGDKLIVFVVILFTYTCVHFGPN